MTLHALDVACINNQQPLHIAHQMSAVMLLHGKLVSLSRTYSLFCSLFSYALPSCRFDVGACAG